MEIIFLSAAFLVVWGGTMYLWREDKKSWVVREATLLKREDDWATRLMSRDAQDYAITTAYQRTYADLKDHPRRQPVTDAMEAQMERDRAGEFSAERDLRR